MTRGLQYGAFCAAVGIAALLLLDDNHAPAPDETTSRDQLQPRPSQGNGGAVAGRKTTPANAKTEQWARPTGEDAVAANERAEAGSMVMEEIAQVEKKLEAAERAGDHAGAERLNEQLRHLEQMKLLTVAIADE